MITQYETNILSKCILASTTFTYSRIQPLHINLNLEKLIDGILSSIPFNIYVSEATKCILVWHLSTYLMLPDQLVFVEARRLPPPSF
jgi:hypothetical protein